MDTVAGRIDRELPRRSPREVLLPHGLHARHRVPADSNPWNADHDLCGNPPSAISPHIAPACCQTETSRRKSLHRNSAQSRFDPLLRSGRNSRRQQESRTECAGAGRVRNIRLICHFLAFLAISNVAVPVITCAADPVPGRGEIYTERFDGSEVSWKASNANTSALLAGQARVPADDQSHGQCELLHFRSPELVPGLRIAIPVPPGRAFDEVLASIRVRATCVNLRLALRINFPNQLDPRTGQPLTVDLVGDPYTNIAEWQQLTCRPESEALRSQIIRLRGQLSNAGRPVSIDTREPYIDEVALLFQAPVGDGYLAIDDLEFGPVVRPRHEADQDRSRQIVRPSEMTVGHDRILRDGVPHFPLFTIHHGEPVDEILRSGVNSLWIEHEDDVDLMQDLSSAGLGIFARPPRIPADVALRQHAALPTFSDETAPVLAWILGVDIPTKELNYIQAWADQIRDADRQFRRPILADVGGLERRFHRKLSVLGASQAMVHTTINPDEYLKRLEHRRMLGLPGKPLFTFIATEPAPALVRSAITADSRPIIEPEQIWLQGFTAISAGYKGIGFWKDHPFDSDDPTSRERQAAIRLFCIHSRLLERAIATGRVTDHVEVRMGGGSTPEHGSANPFVTRWDRTITQANAERGLTEAAPAGPIRACVIQHDQGLLILPVWYEPQAQFQPGPCAARDIRMLVRGIDFPQAWEVTTTGISQANLELTPVAGGTEIHLRGFDQHAAIIVTSNANEVDRLRQLATELRVQAAADWVEVARQKYQRVESVHRLLANQAPPVTGAENLLRNAKLWLDESTRQLTRRHYDDVRVAAQRSLQYMRLLQRRHWENAADTLGNAAICPSAISYQTLPDFWELLAEVGRRRPVTGNALIGGDFEETSVLTSSWIDATPSTASPRGKAQLRSGGCQGNYCLALVTPTLNEPSTPTSLDQPTMVLLSPRIPVRRGEIVHVHGRLRIPAPLQHHPDGFTISESFVGEAGALRFSQPTTGWEDVRMIRHVTEDGHFQMRFQLHALGLVELDDFRVMVLPADD